MTDDEILKAQGKRLVQARIAAGYQSRHGAAVDNRWKPSTYSAHERGARRIGVDDAEEYAKKFRRKGANFSAQYILFGKSDMTQSNEGAVPLVASGPSDLEEAPKLDQEAVQAIVEEAIDLARNLWVPEGVPDDEKEAVIRLAVARASNRLALAPRQSPARIERRAKGELSSP